MREALAKPSIWGWLLRRFVDRAAAIPCVGADPTLPVVTGIVRGADTRRFDLAPEAAGLLAVSLGLTQLHAAADQAMLAAAMPVYDALYRWCRDAATKTHNRPSGGAPA